MSKPAKARRRRAPKSLTNPDDFRQLNPRQANAIDLIVQGRNDREVAEAVGVTRQTVWEWRQQADFIAAVNDLRRQIWGGQTDRLRLLVVRAVDVLERELDGDNAMTAAVHLLKCTGLYGNVSLQPTGQVCPDEIRANQADAKHRRELRLLLPATL